MSDSPFLEAPEEVLSTMNPDGSRKWLFPRLSKGRFWRRRRWVAYALMLLFNVLPWLSMGGRPLVLLDVVHREFTLAGVMFRPTETLLLVLLLLVIFLGVFLVTSLFGRGWCGWACPQTVYMEYLYRPIERLAEGKSAARGQVSLWRRVIKYVLFGIVSVHLSHIFLSYFVGPTTVLSWSMNLPTEHLAGFLIVWGTAAMMFLDFAWFREQMCTLACPYGRFQSVLLDRNSLIVGYDESRAEPRGRLRKGQEAASTGDCVDCSLCVVTCPTGIDIRDGVQMECIACGECIDACDAVMDKLDRPRGLIRYASQESLSGAPTKWLRPRTMIYPVLLIFVLALLLRGVAGRQSAMVQDLRLSDSPFIVMGDQRVRNLVRVRIDNRTIDERDYTISLPINVEAIIPLNPVTIAPGESATAFLHVIVPRANFKSGRHVVAIQFSDGVDFDFTLDKVLLGPLH